VEVNPQRARHALESDEIAIETNALKLKESESIEAPLPAKTWIPWFFPRLQPPEERSIGKVELIQGPTLQCDRKRRSLRVALPPLGKRLELVEAGSANSSLAISIDALF